MKTQTINIEIKAEVPLGNYCSYGCSEFEEMPNSFGYNYCNLFKEETDIENRKTLKCQQCLDACENMNKNVKENKCG